MEEAALTLGTVEPFNVPQPPPHFLLLLLRPRHLLLLPRTELHVSALGVAVGGTRCGTTATQRRTCTACQATTIHSNAQTRRAGTAGIVGVLKAAGVDGEVALVLQTPIAHVPLLRAQSSYKLFVVGDHEDTTLVIADGNSQATQSVTVQEISRFVEHEKMRVRPHGTCDHGLAMLKG